MLFASFFDSMLTETKNHKRFMMMDSRGYAWKRTWGYTLSYKAGPKGLGLPPRFHHLLKTPHPHQLPHNLTLIVFDQSENIVAFQTIVLNSATICEAQMTVHEPSSRFAGEKSCARQDSRVRKGQAEISGYYC